MDMMTLAVGQNTWIDFVGSTGIGRHELQAHELRQIGEFTRDNVLRWMDGHTEPNWVGITPVEDFHAVCGDVDIPWATEEARLLWMKVFKSRTNP